MIKRALDLFCIFVLAPVWIPMMALLSIAVKLSSKGPVLFKQKRIGKNKLYFTIYKFRTMYIDAPQDTPTHLLKNPEHYITPIGKFLRNSSLDELPQILNLIKGEVTLVGPRPALWNQDDLLNERDKFGANKITPGITGWAQVNGRDTLSIKEKAKYDGYYTQHMGLRLDIKILLMTIPKVLRSSGVKEGTAEDV